MSNPYDPQSPDKLDRLLQGWRTAREAGADRLSALQRQIVDRLAAEPREKTTLPASQERWRRRGLASGGSAWLLAVAAAVLLLVGLGVWLRPPVVDPGQHDVPLAIQQPDRPAALSKTELSAKARLFAETQALFGTQLDWLAETADSVALGLAGDEVASMDDRPVVVRIVVERRNAGATDWHVVWSTDVIARDQQPVALHPEDGATPAELSLWAYRLPDGMLFVESDLVLQGAASAVKAATSNLLENNRSTEVGTVDAGGAEYRILETAATLGGDLG